MDWTWFVTGQLLLHFWACHRYRQDARPLAVMSDPAGSFYRNGDGVA
jgi:hypothetical protein